MEKTRKEHQAEKESLESKVARLEREVAHLKNDCTTLVSEAPEDRAGILDKNLQKAKERIVKLSQRVKDLTSDKEAAIAQAKAETRAACEEDEATTLGKLMKQKEIEVQETELNGKLASYKVGWEASSTVVYDILVYNNFLRKEITKSARFSEPIYLVNFKKVVLERYQGLGFSNLKFSFTEKLPNELIEKEKEVLQREQEERHRTGHISEPEGEEEEERRVEATCSMGYNPSLPCEIANKLYSKFRQEFEEYQRVMEWSLRIDQEAGQSSPPAQGNESSLEKDKKKGKRQMGE